MMLRLTSPRLPHPPQCSTCCAFLVYAAGTGRMTAPRHLSRFSQSTDCDASNRHTFRCRHPYCSRELYSAFAVAFGSPSSGADSCSCPTSAGSPVHRRSALPLVLTVDTSGPAVVSFGPCRIRPAFTHGTDRSAPGGRTVHTRCTPCGRRCCSPPSSWPGTAAVRSCSAPSGPPPCPAAPDPAHTLGAG